MSSTTEMKSVVVLSQAYDDRLAQQLNALGHLAQALGVDASKYHGFKTAEYTDAVQRPLAKLSWWPLIVLSGRATKVAEFWNDLQSRELPKACFVESMISGGSGAQLEATAKLQSPLPIIAISAFGPASDLNALTKKLSLWRAPIAKRTTPL